MSHLKKWEKQCGNKYEWADGEVTLGKKMGMGLDEIGLVCRNEGCLRIFNPKTGRTAHVKRIHDSRGAN